ncbi:DUF1428 domain-containing protein [Hyalangium minutum]|uniref:RNA signal recognition particle 4.5S RNA n=1 Tax=Hyalangium minutum TaxID=394096 RepID=A0A085WF56_9BACT|nr:DUF1428 domain-containing protein [Hyalangium minutum]KFE66319.1 hypothetical protein DB31_0792 [Hyalangium minutum]
MATYVDGFIIPIKKANLKAYKKMATIGRKVWMEHGALQYFECIGDDLQEKMGMPFKKMCKLKPDETLAFSFIIYKSKADRNRVNKLVHADPRMQPEQYKTFKMPFDMKRFSFGGFKTIVQG